MNKSRGGIGIYIHVPFCQRKCSYCDFYSTCEAAGPMMDEYVKALLTHISESAQFTGKNAKLHSFMAETVYFGGGTPTLLGIKRLRKLLASLQKNYQIAPGAEITLEANPGTVDLKMLTKLRKAGFNRISFGVQAIQPELLSVLGRIHDAEEAADAVRYAAAAGFRNISVDIMYGIPGQTWEMLEETLRTVFSWPIQHLSLYGLKLEEGTPLHKQNPTLPSDDTQADHYLKAVALLEEEGFAQYEISNFAKEGLYCRHNYKYWTLEPYMGFGASAHSDIGGRRYGYIKEVQGYIDGVTQSDNIMEDMQEIKMIERAGEYIMLGLRTVRGISSNEYTRLFNASFDTLENKLELCERWELCERTGDRWRLTPKGFLVSNQIIGQLLDPKAEVEG